MPWPPPHSSRTCPPGDQGQGEGDTSAVSTHQHPHQAPGLQLGNVLQLARPREPLLALLTPGDHSEHANMYISIRPLDPYCHESSWL